MSIFASGIGSTATVYRDGNILVVPSGCCLPATCVKCGMPVSGKPLTKTFRWHSSWLYLLILPGLLFYVIAALAVEKKARIDVPFCDQLPLPSYLGGFLPAEIKTTDFSLRKVLNKVNDGEIEYDVEVRDFHIPLQEFSNVWLRQIILGKQSERITSLWWALYDHGRRSDVWSYRADPGLTEHKILPNYEMVDASASASGFDLRVYGSMFRPQGAWSVTGKTFYFSARVQAIELSRVLNNFGFFRSYDSRDTSVMIERKVGTRIELLDYDKVRERTLHSCKFQDPADTDDWAFEWTRMEREASCIAQKEKGRVSYREADQPSFIERGWKER